MFNDNGKKIIATIEARMTSSRLPGKVLMDLCGKPALQHIVERLKRSSYIDDVVVATTVNATDNPVVELCNSIGCSYFRGSEEDVLLRVLLAAKNAEADVLVEITGDCPLVDWRIVDEAIELFFSDSYDYASNALESNYPSGFEVQVFPVTVLNEVNSISNDPLDHEHVSLYIYRHPEKYRLACLKAEGKLCRPEVEVTLDTMEDYQIISRIFNSLYPKNQDFGLFDVIELLEKRPELLDINKNVKRKTV